MERFLNQQNIDRYMKLLSVISDKIQRRQILSLLEEEKEKAGELHRAGHRIDQPEAA